MILTPSHLAIVMEYASGGELYERICNAGRFSEDEVCILIYIFILLYRSIDVLLLIFEFFLFFNVQARFFFQQLISGVSYCHAMVCRAEFLLLKLFAFLVLAFVSCPPMIYSGC